MQTLRGSDAQQIRLVRNGLGLNQKEFGSLFDVSAKQVSNWETAKTTPSIFKIAVIEAFGVSVNRDGGVRTDLDAVLASCGPTYVLWLLLNSAYGVTPPERDPLAPPQ